MKIQIIKKHRGKLSPEKRRQIRNRNKIKSVNSGKYRLSVFRSRLNIEAQLIDDSRGVTLFAFSSLSLDKKNKIGKFEQSNLIGAEVAKFAKDKEIDPAKIYFDRGGYKYHGRVAAVKEGFDKIFGGKK